ncbi:MAG: alkaline phosphatase family protein [Gemmatimonadales bacterium]
MSILAQGFAGLARVIVCFSALAGIGPLSAQPVTDHRVIVVTLDGMRWQEVFGGADSTLAFGRAGGVRDTTDFRRRFWRSSPEERRAALLPFFWREIAARGQVLGDSAGGSIVRVTNGKRFSYPGYNELFAGAPDDRIDSNDKIPNPNVTVLEWLHQRQPFRGRIAVFGSWDVFPFIFNTERSGVPVTALGPPFPGARSPTERLINDYTTDLPHLWTGAALDAPVMQAALETMRSLSPRVLVILLGETDEWAHSRRYDLYLDAAHRADRLLERLWEMAQSLDGYRGNTSLLVSTDHGRGAGNDWTDHGREVTAADRIWMAVMGPPAPPMGIRRGVQVTQSQFAATIAALLGEDFQRSRPGIAPPILNPLW